MQPGVFQWRVVRLVHNVLRLRKALNTVRHAKYAKMASTQQSEVVAVQFAEVVLYHLKTNQNVKNV